jgi:hypothetical protein
MFESLVAKTGFKLTLADGTTFENVEDVTKFVYNLSVAKTIS